MKTARAIAEKNAKAVVNGKPLSVTEYREAVSLQAEKIFKTMPVRLLSPVYSNITEAQQYQAICKKSGGYEKTIIRRRLQVLDGDGKPVLTKKTKKPTLYWEDVSGAE